MHPELSKIPAFFHPGDESSADHVTLTPEESRHVRAQRLRVGSSVVLLDGNGGRAEGIVQACTPAGVTVTIVRRMFEHRKGGAYIGLAMALLSDRTRMDWLVEKGTEIGVSEIIFMETERSEGRFHGERLHRVAIAALKQSRRLFLPRITAPRPFVEVLREDPPFDRIVFCDERAEPSADLASLLLRDASPRRQLLIVGPEGGFTESERAEAEKVSASVVSLGPFRLRAETAALVAMVLATSLPGTTSRLS